MLRVGLVGAGFIGRIHSWSLWGLRKIDRVDAAVTVVCDADAGRARELAEPHGADVRTRVDDVLTDTDVVYVCTPTAQHEELVVAAADAGLAVFCEKPLAPTYPRSEAVASALRRAPHHQVGLVLRHAPVFRRLAHELSSGVYGRTMTVVLRDDQYFPNQGQYASTWRDDVALSGGGTLIEHSIHDLDLFRWLVGEPNSVTARTASFFGHPGIEDLATATLAYPDGRSAVLVSVWHQVLSRPSTRRLEVFCEDALLWTDDDNTGPLHVQTSDSESVLECPLPEWVDDLPMPEAVRRPLGLYATADEAFLEGVASGRASDGGPDADDALAAHRLVDAAYRSAAGDGCAVRP